MTLRNYHALVLWAAALACWGALAAIGWCLLASGAGAQPIEAAGYAGIAVAVPIAVAAIRLLRTLATDPGLLRADVAADGSIRLAWTRPFRRTAETLPPASVASVALREMPTCGEAAGDLDAEAVQQLVLVLHDGRQIAVTHPMAQAAARRRAAQLRQALGLS